MRSALSRVLPRRLRVDLQLKLDTGWIVVGVGFGHGEEAGARSSRRPRRSRRAGLPHRARQERAYTGRLGFS